VPRRQCEQVPAQQRPRIRDHEQHDGDDEEGEHERGGERVHVLPEVADHRHRPLRDHQQLTLHRGVVAQHGGEAACHLLHQLRHLLDQPRHLVQQPRHDQPARTPEQQQQGHRCDRRPPAAGDPLPLHPRHRRVHRQADDQRQKKDHHHLLDLVQEPEQDDQRRDQVCGTGEAGEKV
jgi:hypothetical protein